MTRSPASPRGSRPGGATAARGREVAARGRRNFGLQFMRERAELIGAQLDVRSRPEGGTVVRLAIQTGTGTGAEESR